MRINFIYVCLLAVSCAGPAEKKEPATSYAISEQGISETVLENYLKRSVTMAEFLTVDPYCVDVTYPAKADDIRLINNIGAKFIGRAIYRWGKEDMINQAGWLDSAALLVKAVHAQDSTVIFQGAIFECVTKKVNTVAVPDWAFQLMELPVEQRNFRYDSMLNKEGKYVNQWAPGSSVPDITRPETKLWMIFLAAKYINLGCEALHYGQIDLMGMADAGYGEWAKYLAKVRTYARQHARRQWVLMDAHTPYGGMVINDTSLLDFNAFPLRIKEVVDSPMQGVLQKGYLDAIYGRSKACVTPSGWRSEELPYLVELDNFGASPNPGKPDTASHFAWGYDEITWFYLQPQEYRKQWLWYAQRWINDNDQTGYLEMPVSRLIDQGQGKPIIKNRANTPSAAVPDGMDLEETIKAIWQQETRKS
ncbi:MAG: hypothetical protein P0Y53_00830 [Candidatus Pseudobacter hemicellulosilyticus]|uniref:Uncharacterized protein n=1 Tax=Candidatus Pseudobacter hemicellulosilyticus TaxID=3121375 RepID=A0AAJ5WXA5_9BACT|nr:MAG: hypothetical protein P0Y53_00830 [Pseudobacter sp.]